MARQYIGEAESMTAGDSLADIASLEGLPWIFPIRHCADWVSFAQAAHQRVCAEVIAAAVPKLHDLAQTLSSATPPFEELFKAATIDLKLADKTLVRWPKKKSLGQGAAALEHAITETSKAYTEWGLEGTLRDHAPSAEVMRQVGSIYLRAKKACYITGGVNCLVNLKGDEKLKKRASLLLPETQKLLPPQLVKLLEKVK